MAAWLVKTEADEWGWHDQEGVDAAPWTGVRNFAAQKNMRAMKLGDAVLFYHTGNERRIVGLCTVVREAYPDPGDETGRFCLVDLKAAKTATNPVTLAEIKAREDMAHLALVRQARLSVMPIDDAAFRTIAALADFR
ncbi:MAG: EVE domain-containing protein [Alphaproteobacteria bacterium]|nr:MAG: EVE domain-containing protein [Alphaproteobacteria bacterium]